MEVSVGRVRVARAPAPTLIERMLHVPGRLPLPEIGATIKARIVEAAGYAVPRDAVLKVVDDCAERGVRALVVITAGFAEVSEEGKRLQRELVDKARGYGMRIVGPNCLGLINADPQVKLNASF